eukprot:220174-Hanusia_phi.AAC.1
MDMAMMEGSDQQLRFFRYKRFCCCAVNVTFYSMIDKTLSSCCKRLHAKQVGTSVHRLSDYTSFLSEPAQNSLNEFIRSRDHFQTLFEFAMLKISLPCDILDRALEDGSNGFRNASWTSIFFSSTPVTALLWKFQTIFIFSLIAVALSLLFVRGRFLNQDLKLFSMNAVLFKTVKTRNGTDGILLASPPVSDLVLLRRGCPINQTSAHLWLQGADAVIYSNELLGFNAVGFRTRAERGSEGIDPVTFNVFGMQGEFIPGQQSTTGKKWRLIGSSASYNLQSQCGENAVRASRDFETSSQRGSLTMLDLQPTWHDNLLVYGVYIPMIFAYLITILSRIYNIIQLSQTFISITIMGPGFVVLVASVGLLIQGRDFYYANFPQFIQGFLWVIFGSLALFGQKWFLSFIPVLWSVIFLLTPIQALAVCNELRFYLQPDPLAFLCMYLIIMLSRHLTKFVSYKKIEKDLQAYETEWNVIRQSNISDVQSKLKMLQSMFTGNVLQQFVAMQVEEHDVSTHAQVNLAILSNLQVKPTLVRSLDQLYAQAVLVYPLFLRK